VAFFFYCFCSHGQGRPCIGGVPRYRLWRRQLPAVQEPAQHRVP
jgi:hypothetical protein